MERSPFADLLLNQPDELGKSRDSMKEKTRIHALEIRREMEITEREVGEGKFRK